MGRAFEAWGIGLHCGSGKGVSFVFVLLCEHRSGQTMLGLRTEDASFSV